MRADTVKRCFVEFSDVFFQLCFHFLFIGACPVLHLRESLSYAPIHPRHSVVSCVRFRLPCPGGWLFRVVQLYMLIFGAVILLIESQSSLVPPNILVVRARPQPSLP